MTPAERREEFLNAQDPLPKARLTEAVRLRDSTVSPALRRAVSRAQDHLDRYGHVRLEGVPFRWFRQAETSERTAILGPTLPYLPDTRGPSSVERARAIRLAEVATRIVAPMALEPVFPAIAKLLRDLPPLAPPLGSDFPRWSAWSATTLTWSEVERVVHWNLGMLAGPLANRPVVKPEAHARWATHAAFETYRHAVWGGAAGGSARAGDSFVRTVHDARQALSSVRPWSVFRATIIELACQSRCPVHPDCREHPELGQACFDASIRFWTEGL